MRPIFLQNWLPSFTMQCIHNNIITYCCQRHHDDFGGLVDRGGGSSKLPTSCILQDTLVSHWWASQPWCIFSSHHLPFLSPSIHIRIDTEFHCHVSIFTWILLTSLTVMCMAFSGQRKVDMEAPPFWLALHGGVWQNGMPTCEVIMHLLHTRQAGWKPPNVQKDGTSKFWNWKPSLGCE
jgi:hypothetical protein